MKRKRTKDSPRIWRFMRWMRRCLTPGGPFWLKVSPRRAWWLARVIGDRAPTEAERAFGESLSKVGDAIAEAVEHHALNSRKINDWCDAYVRGTGKED